MMCYFSEAGSMRGVIVMLLLAGLVFSPRTSAQGVDLTPDAELDAAVERGLAFLARQQRRDGSFEGGGPVLAMTGLSLMAFLASGHTPEVGRYGTVVRSAV